MTIRILALSGSSRRNSLNQKLLEIAMIGACGAGAEVTPVRLSDYGLPLYDVDLEAERGLPDGVVALQELMARHDAILFATPEHNGGYTALLKNAIDWTSRPRPNGSSGIALFAGKVAALISASPGPLGGIRSQLALRMVLEKLGMVVIPEEFALSFAYEAFSTNGGLKDEGKERLVGNVGSALYRAAARFA